MKKFVTQFARAAAVASLALLAGCIGTQVGRLDINHATALQAKYYVEHQPKDERGLDQVIAERMRARGYNAVAGDSRPADANYVVTYVDKWAWDMRMYLLDLRIDLRDAKDASSVGYGESMQSSLKAMGKSFGDAALDQLFKK